MKGKVPVKGKIANKEENKTTAPTKRAPKMSEYGKQLAEKQKVKQMYGLLEKQFKRFFDKAVRTPGAPGEVLLSLLERRLDNVVYRLKLTTTRPQARQVVVHGHILVNGKKVYSPSYLVKPNDEISLVNNVLEKKGFLENVIDKRLNIGIKVPDWLELDKKDRKGRILRNPIRADIQAPIEEHLIVELYSK
ncbi:MAG: 30S ribosomal protein S4 [candidate division TM6 bacterium GW2011_GWF2_32_72]|nr:MAG: 30S ribosomal protein S4 [candidate division TM6 bacterium GW2011_GWF2_32_72]